MKAVAQLQDLSKRALARLCSFLRPSNLIVFALIQTGMAVSVQPQVVELVDSASLIERLNNTNLLNGIQIYDQLKLAPIRNSTGPGPCATPTHVFFTANPYKPRYAHSFERFADIERRLPRKGRSFEVNGPKHQLAFFGQKPVWTWYAALPTNTEVCGARFTDTRREDYDLRTFSNADDALANNYVITHRYHCGTCSSHRNLAVYFAKPDLTTPARSCARKLTFWGTKRCLMETIGFEELCAETWAYNIAHTKRQCMSTCLKHYGIWRVIRNDMGDAHVEEDGRLNPCLACDEYASGPGFQYAAGRTRRASGLISSIQRSAFEIYPVDHNLYFE